MFKKRGKIKSTVGAIRFPDLKPTLWRELRLNDRQAKLGYQQMLEEFPISDRRILTRNDVRLGYHSDLDRDGTRNFISLDENGDVDLGLDVPCEDLDLYLSGLSHTRHVLTPWVELCRVTALRFKK